MVTLADCYDDRLIIRVLRCDCHMGMWTDEAARTSERSAPCPEGEGRMRTMRDETSPRRDLVWYASYGSNLAYQERFLCYIKGGTPAGSRKMNPDRKSTRLNSSHLV